MNMKNIYKIAGIVIALSGASNAIAAPMASSEILTGSTYNNPNSFQFTNNSDAGENITRLVWDLSPINGFFDSAITDPGVSPKPFTIGLSDDVGVTEPDNLLLDGKSVLELLFSDFNVGETFRFGVDTDLFSAIDATGINGNQFAGATITAYFDSGFVTTGIYGLDNKGGSSVEINTIVDVPTPMTGALFGFALAGLFGLRRKKS